MSIVRILGERAATNSPKMLLPAWNTLAVAHVRGQLRLVTSHGVQALKILQPSAPGSARHVVLSSYGGGLVTGDWPSWPSRNSRGTIH